MPFNKRILLLQVRTIQVKVTEVIFPISEYEPIPVRLPAEVLVCQGCYGQCLRLRWGKQIRLMSL